MSRTILTRITQPDTDLVDRVAGCVCDSRRRRTTAERDRWVPVEPLGCDYHGGVEARVMPIPAGLEAGAGIAFEPVAGVDDLPVGGMLRITRGDVDLLVVHIDEGICVIDDRCPHMSAPLSIGELDGCVVACPLHRGRFDLATGETVQFPTTGGLDADGGYHPPWSPAGSAERTEPTDLKARARALTRVRRLRYYPVRIRSGVIEVAFPAES